MFMQGKKGVILGVDVGKIYTSLLIFLEFKNSFISSTKFAVDFLV